MYILNVKRIKEYEDVVTPGTSKKEDSTISEVSLINEENNDILWKGFCCENIGPSTDKSGTDKRIIARQYKLKWRSSGKNGALVKKYPQWLREDGRNTAIHVVSNDIEGFNSRLILIHTGNGPAHTEGCLLMGKLTINGTVSQSVDAIHELFTIIKKIGIENVILNVIEI